LYAFEIKRKRPMRRGMFKGRKFYFDGEITSVEYVASEWRLWGGDLIEHRLIQTTFRIEFDEKRGLSSEVVRIAKPDYVLAEDVEMLARKSIEAYLWATGFWEQRVTSGQHQARKKEEHPKPS
jgi:hypothetical protein